ncbi:MAG: hypothetical protein FWF51_09805 [Chitinivibrionia bacterium]|nr:hypothetical protein [Chitinivibrionia bacterium]
MKEYFYILAISVLLCGGGGAMCFADVKAYADSDGYKVELENKTNSAWIMGGVRFKNNGQNLQLQYGSAKIRKTGSNEYDVYQVSTQPQHAKLLAPGRRQDVANFQPATWGQPTEPYKIDESSLEVLLRTGAPGIPQDPDEEKPNTLDELRELVKKSDESDFYNENYRLQKPDGKGGMQRYYDSLGVNGGLYSGGYMDTYLGETQLHFAIPKGNVTGVWSEGKVARGNEEPLYWLSMGMIQEYFRVDNQWMFSVGAKESGIGMSVTTPESNLAQPGVYGWWQIERDAGLDKFLAYPQFFPKYETILTNAVVVNGIPNGEEIMKYYMRGDQSYSPKSSALMFNSSFCSAIFQYVMYDALSYSNDVCWKFALSNAIDPYMALAAMNLIYNTGEFGTSETIRNAFSNANIDALVNNPNASQIFEGGFGGYTSQIRAVAQQLINASKDFELNGGNNSELIDFEITLEQLRQIFFGDNGTVAKQGNGGLLLHYYDPAAGKDVSAIRQKIWNTLDDAFNVCKGLSPTTRGKNAISYRYDFLSVLRTVKEDLPFVRRLNFAGNMGTIIPNDYDKNKNPCGKDAGAGDETYPYANVTVAPDEEFCSVIVNMNDDNLCGKVRWSIDYDWAIWNTANMVETAPAKQNSFEFEIPKEMADAFADRGDESGKFVWIMAEDVAGNSVVVKRAIEFRTPPPPPPLNTIDFKVKNAWYFDDSNPADGYIDRIKMEFEFDFSEYSEFKFSEFVPHIEDIVKNNFTLPSARKFSVKSVDVIDNTSLKISVSQETDKVDVKTSVDNSDKFTVQSNLIHKFNDTLQIRAVGQFEIKDSVAPIITSGRYRFMKIENENDKIIDTLTLVFSEKLSGSVAKNSIGAFSKTKNSQYSFKFDDTFAQNDSIVKIEVEYDGNNLPDLGDSVRIQLNSAITDKEFIRQKLNTVWAPLSVVEGEGNYDVSIYPNPYSPNGEFETADGRTDKNPVIEKWGNSYEAKNLAVVVKPIGQRGSMKKELTAKITIIDALGNTIVENKEFSQGKDGVLIWTWNGKNVRGRTVGAGTYLAIISVIDETGENAPFLRTRKIGIKK